MSVVNKVGVKQLLNGKHYYCLVLFSKQRQLIQKVGE